MEKTLAPTPRQLRRALREGDSPISIPLVRAAALVGGMLVLPPAAQVLKARFDDLLRTAVRKPDAALPLRVAEEVALIAGPLVAVAAVAALAVGLVQTNAVVTFRRNTPGIRPGGLRAFDALRGSTVTVMLLVVALRALSVAAPDGARVVAGEEESLGFAAGLIVHVLWLSVLGLLVLAALDVVVKRAAWVDRWRMSPRDVIEEKRETEGDPGVRRARRRAHEEWVQGAPRDRDRS